MGMQSFVNTAEARTPEEAYAKLVDQALYEKGHDSYNGTISTTSGFIFLGRAAEPYAMAHDYQTWPENIQKWGRCGCVEIDPLGNDRRFVFFGWAAI
jgi:hypothetical protein